VEATLCLTKNLVTSSSWEGGAHKRISEYEIVRESTRWSTINASAGYIKGKRCRRIGLRSTRIPTHNHHINISLEVPVTAATMGDIIQAIGLIGSALGIFGFFKTNLPSNAPNGAVVRMKVGNQDYASENYVGLLDPYMGAE